MSLLVETKQTKSATLDSPKDILFTFMEEFMTQLQESSLTEVGKEILREFKNGEIQIYMFNIWENEVLKSLHLQSEPTYNDSLDFDYPVYTSI
ncbi:MAG: hypothetical protein H6767_00990 [Candidatus Peribacteria bacterium]|nr:MAG: hypothetical protein H6767_00990 [Candidatus Peribacteria bacterium]